MSKANIVDLKNNLKHFLGLVTEGVVVTIMKRNVPVAQIIPLKAKHINKTSLGCGAGSVEFVGSLTDPFIPEEDWDMHT